MLVETYSDAETAGQLAAEVAQRIQGVAVILTEGKLLFAVYDRGTLHAGNIARDFAARAGLRGGGGPRAAQVGGAEGDKLEEYRTLIREIVVNA